MNGGRVGCAPCSFNSVGCVTWCDLLVRCLHAWGSVLSIAKGLSHCLEQSNTRTPRIDCFGDGDMAELTYVFSFGSADPAAGKQKPRLGFEWFIPTSSGRRGGPTVDGRNPAPPKKPWNADSPVSTNQPWFPMVSKWCRISSIHCIASLGEENATSLETWQKH